MAQGISAPSWAPDDGVVSSQDPLLSYVSSRFDEGIGEPPTLLVDYPPYLFGAYESSAEAARPGFAPVDPSPMVVVAVPEDAPVLYEEEIPFSYVRVVRGPWHKLEEIPDSVFYESARGVIFPVNKYELPASDPWLKEVGEKVVPWSIRNNLVLRHVEMRGASSPEGPLKWNDFLAMKRSQSLQDVLQRMFDVDYALVDSAVVENPEDYKALLYMMRNNHDVDYPLVCDILERHAGDREAIKAELQRVNKGALWRRLLAMYYPSIRYARVLLFFTPPVEYELPVAGVRDTFRPLTFEGKDLELDVCLQPIIMQSQQLPIDATRSMGIVPRRRVLALRSNLLYDALYVPGHGWAPSPNIAMEFFPAKGRFTYNAELTYPDWEEWPNPQKFWQIHDYQFGVRCYTRRHKVAPGDGGPYASLAADYFQGFFVGAYVQAGRYGIGFNKDKGWEGEYAGAGLQVGYTLPLSKCHRWRLEFTASAGALVTKYDPYVYGNPVSGDLDGFYYYNWTHSADLFIKRNHRLTWIGPTGLGVHLTYDLLYKRQLKKGVSTRRWESR